MTVRWYDRDGKPLVDAELGSSKWRQQMGEVEKLMSDRHYKQIAWTLVDETGTALDLGPDDDATLQPTDSSILVSTVWVGLDHNFMGGAPLIFETMTFAAEDNELNEMQWRYPTEAAALAGHDQAVALVREAIAASR